MREVMTPEQVAAYLQLNKDTIYRLIRQRRLAAVRIGRAYRVPKEDLDTFLVANSTRAAIRETIFNRAREIGQRQPELDGDLVLDGLEQLDEERRGTRRAV